MLLIEIIFKKVTTALFYLKLSVNCQLFSNFFKCFYVIYCVFSMSLIIGTIEQKLTDKKKLKQNHSIFVQVKFVPLHDTDI